jgi:DNA-binding GntR family transcriptional regulator
MLIKHGFGLGVSQVTVREALVELEHFGLVVRTPNIGSHVTRHSSREIRERVAIRVLLEGEAAVEASQRMSKEDLAELEKRLEAISERREARPRAREEC